MLKPINPLEFGDRVRACLGQGVIKPIASSEAGELESQAIPNFRILLVEDGLANQRLALGQLQKHGHDVDVVDNGRKAVQSWERGGYDLILMDVEMPVMDGLEATREIRRREQESYLGGGHPHIPIIAMTARAMKGDREMCLDAGMDEYITKPVKMSDLRSAIREVIPGIATPSLAVSGFDEEQSGFHYRNTLHELGGDTELLCELMQCSLEECRGCLEELRESVVAGDLDKAGKTAHLIKGTLSHFASGSALAILARLEQLCRQGNRPAVEKDLASLEARLRFIFDEMESFIKDKAMGST